MSPDTAARKLIEILTAVIEDGFCIPDLDEAEATVDAAPGVVVIFKGRRIRLSAEPEEHQP